MGVSYVRDIRWLFLRIPWAQQAVQVCKKEEEEVGVEQRRTGSSGALIRPSRPCERARNNGCRNAMQNGFNELLADGSFNPAGRESVQKRRCRKATQRQLQMAHSAQQAVRVPWAHPLGKACWAGKRRKMGSDDCFRVPVATFGGCGQLLAALGCSSLLLVALGLNSVAFG